MAAGIWATGSGLGDANITVMERTIAAALHTSIKNRTIIAHPVMQSMLMADEGIGPLLGSLGVSFGLAAIGQGTMAATAEGTEASATNFSISNSTTITPARRSYVRDIADFGRSVQEGLLRGDLGPDTLALLTYEGMRTWENSVVATLIALASSLTTTSIGTTGTALTWNALQDGIFDLKDAGNGARGLGLLTAKGAKDLADDGLALGGAAAFSNQVQGLLPSLEAGAYIGTFMGVDFFLCTGLPTSGGDTHGMIITEGCLATKHQPVPLPPEATGILGTPFFTLEGRRPGGGVTRYDLTSHYGAQIREAARGARIIYSTT